MKNLKQNYEKGDARDWQEFMGKEAREKRFRKLRRDRSDRHNRWNKQDQRLRSTWE